MRGLAMLANLGVIGPPQVEAELIGRGLFIKQLFPEEQILAPPDYPEAPMEPVVVVPGPGPDIWQPLLPEISPDMEAWEQVTPAPIVEPVGAEPVISKTVMIAGGVILGALLLFSGRKSTQAPAQRRKRPQPRAAARAQYPPAEEPAEEYEEPEWEDYNVDQD